MSQRILPPIEPLERRRLMSAATLAGGVLRVRGDAAASIISIANSADGNSIDVTVASNAVQTLARSFPRAQGITSIQVLAGRFNDLVSIGQANALAGIAAFDMPARVFSGRGDDIIFLTNAVDFVLPGAGNDIVVAAGGNDVVFAGLGNDNVDGGEGDDVIRGMVGNDTVGGGGGADRVAGNVGNDSVTGGPGDDVLRGDVGDDTVEGGPDNDTAFGGLGNDILRGGGGNDALWGGVGDDTLEGGNGNDDLGGIIGRNTLLGGQDADTFHVRDLVLNGTNDYNPTQGDVLDANPRAKGEGPQPPPI